MGRLVLVMATGVFDLVHVGHLRFLSDARALGDELVVVVATDATVRSRKHEPIFSQELRREMVEGLKPVSRAVVGYQEDHLRIVQELKPDIIALGYDQDVDEAALKLDLERRGVLCTFVRLKEHPDELGATRRIIQRVVDWYSLKTRLESIEGAER